MPILVLDSLLMSLAKVVEVLELISMGLIENSVPRISPSPAGFVPIEPKSAPTAPKALPVPKVLAVPKLKFLPNSIIKSSDCALLLFISPMFIRAISAMDLPSVKIFVFMLLLLGQLI